MRLVTLGGLILLLSSPFSPILSAQTCAGAATLLKNDNLAANVAWPFQSRPISSLAANDAAGAIFDVSLIAAVVTLNSAAVGFADGLGGNSGAMAPVNLEIYDGIAWNGNLPVLGPKVFDWVSLTGSPITLTATAINVVSLAGLGVQISSGRVVLAWTMLVGNLGSINLATDGTANTGFACNPTTTPPMRNLVYRNGLGWFDCTSGAPLVIGLPFCPFSYSGNWLMRACVSSASLSDSISISGSPIHSPGTGTVTFSFAYPGASYVGGAAFFPAPGIPTPIGIVPLANDALLSFSLSTPSVFAGFSGVLGPTGAATGSIIVPPGVGPASFFIAAVAYSPQPFQLLAITNAAPVGVW